MKNRSLNIHHFSSVSSIKVIKKTKNNTHINKPDKLVDKSISFHLMYGLTRFYGFIEIL